MGDFPLISDGERRELLAPPSGVVDVVIDTDVTNELDDQFAIVWAALRPDRLRIVGLHACPYSLSPALVEGGALLTPLDERNLRATLATHGVGVDQIPVVAPADGVARARAELETIVELLGLDPAVVRTGADRYLASPTEPVVSEATEHLIELARAATEPLQVVAIGCATNVASALLAEPSIATRIVVSWTSAYPSFWPSPNASFNLAQDLHAARVLLDSGVPLVYLPGYYVAEELRTTLAELHEHLAGHGPIGDYLYRVYEQHPLGGEHRARSKVIWDMVNIGWLLEPAWLTTGLVPTPQLGEDLRWVHGPDRPVMREAVDLDRDAMFGDLFRCVADAAGTPTDP